jgi:hypothetical protein
VRHLRRSTDQPPRARRWQAHQAGTSTLEVSELAQALSRLFEELGRSQAAAEIADRFMTAEARLSAFGAMASTLEPVAVSLDQAGPPVQPLSPEALTAMAELRRIYTMSAERSVHDLLIPKADLAANDPDEDVVLFA